MYPEHLPQSIRGVSRSASRRPVLLQTEGYMSRHITPSKNYGLFSQPEATAHHRRSLMKLAEIVFLSDELHYEHKAVTDL